jgi:hypothetical protein
MILGNITLLEQKGCRFQPDDPRDIGRIADEAAKRPISLIGYGLEVPGHVYRLDDADLGVFFDLPLESRWRKHLLEQSTTIPLITAEKPKMSNVIRASRAEPRPAKEITPETLMEYYEASTKSGNRRETDRGRRTA